jgi:hypothetical protein
VNPLPLFNVFTKRGPFICVITKVIDVIFKHAQASMGMRGGFAFVIKGFILKNELPKHCSIDLYMLVGLSQETLPHANSPNAKFNAAGGYFPELEDFFIAHATVDIFVLQGRMLSKSNFHRVCLANHCNTKVFTNSRVDLISL